MASFAGLNGGDYFIANVVGLDQLKNVLESLPIAVRSGVGSKALRQGAMFMQNRVKDRAPVAHLEVRNNNIRYNTRSKRVEFIKLKDEIRIVNGKKAADQVQMFITVGRAYWGMFREFGTRDQSASPFMRPAFDESVEDTIKIITSSLAQGVEDAAAKAYNANRISF